MPADLGFTPEALRASPYAAFWRPALAALPAHVMQAVASGPLAAPLLPPLSQAGLLLDDGYWPVETGYTVAQDGAVRVFVLTEMPAVSPPMWDWWFAWHGSESERYKLWHPGAHVAARWADGKGETGAYVGRTSVVDEYIGPSLQRFGIGFVPPAELGLDSARLTDPARQICICARGGLPNGRVSMGVLIHHIRAVPGGAEMRSRFWLGGENISAPFGWLGARAAGAIAGMGRAQAADLLVHCAQEMNHLAAILPAIYAQFGPGEAGRTA